MMLTEPASVVKKPRPAAWSSIVPEVPAPSIESGPGARAPGPAQPGRQRREVHRSSGYVESSTRCVWTRTRRGRRDARGHRGSPGRSSMFSVKDSGRGDCCATKLDRVFAAFSQADTSSTRQASAGPDSASPSPSVSSHMLGGDSVEVASEPGQGSTVFSLRLYVWGGAPRRAWRWLPARSAGASVAATRRRAHPQGRQVGPSFEGHASSWWKT